MNCPHCSHPIPDAALDSMPLAVLQAVVNRRLPKKPKDLYPCVGCKKLLGARERRKPCPQCGARNPR